jgi:DNA-binding SARP family transcriptional activator
MVELANGSIGLAEVIGLKERKAAAEEDLSEGRLQLGQHNDLLPNLAAAVEAEPMRQRRWAQLMLALYRTGRQKEATETFQRLRRLLIDASGFDPSPELEALDRAILFSDPALQWTPPRESGEVAEPVAISKA